MAKGVSGRCSVAEGVSGRSGVTERASRRGREVAEGVAPLHVVLGHAHHLVGLGVGLGLGLGFGFGLGLEGGHHLRRREVSRRAWRARRWRAGAEPDDALVHLVLSLARALCSQHPRDLAGLTERGAGRGGAREAPSLAAFLAAAGGSGAERTAEAERAAGEDDAPRWRLGRSVRGVGRRAPRGRLGRIRFRRRLPAVWGRLPGVVWGRAGPRLGP
eukprot:scaffold41443_cov55-Phaeocystis_antarctica.AAC.3